MTNTIWEDGQEQNIELVRKENLTLLLHIE
jgi:hypothetical protein